MAERKACVDCTHYTVFGDCLRTERTTWDPVMGHGRDLESARGQRNLLRGMGPSRCGPEARHFEPRPTLLGWLKGLVMGTKSDA